MKKIVALLLACVMVSFALVSCGSSIDGKTYVYDKSEVEWLNDTAGDIANALGGIIDSIGGDIDGMREQIAAQYAKVEFVFEDGKVKLGAEGDYDVAAYEQDGDDIKIVSDGRTVMELEIKGGKLVYEYEINELFEVKVYFKQK